MDGWMDGWRNGWMDGAKEIPFYVDDKVVIKREKAFDLTKI